MANRNYRTNGWYSITDDWLSSLWESMTGSISGAGHTGNFWTDDIANGLQFSPTDFYNMQYELNKISQQQTWQEDMYNRYQSLPAQVQQMQQAGLNPALMYGSGASVGSVSSGGAVGGSPAGGNSPQKSSETMQQVMSAIVSLLQGGANVAKGISDIRQQSVENTNIQADTVLKGSQLDKTAAETDKTNAEKDLLLIEGDLKRIDLQYADAFKRLEKSSFEANISKLKSDALKSFASASKDFSEIEVNGHKIQLMQSEISKNEAEQLYTQTRMMTERLTQQQLIVLLQYQREMAEAEIKMKNATSESLRAQAQNQISQSQLNMLEYVKTEQLMDAGYVDEIIKGMRTDRKTKVVKAVTGGISDIASAFADVTEGVSNIGTMGAKMAGAML